MAPLTARMLHGHHELAPSLRGTRASPGNEPRAEIWRVNQGHSDDKEDSSILGPTAEKTGPLASVSYCCETNTHKPSARRELEASLCHCLQGWLMAAGLSKAAHPPGVSGGRRRGCSLHPVRSFWVGLEAKGPQRLRPQLLSATAEVPKDKRGQDWPAVLSA